MKRIISVFFLLCILCMAAHATEPVDVSAQSAVLYDPLTGFIYYEKDAHERRPMASTTKIMTAIVALERSAPDEIVRVSKEATLIEGSKMYIKEDEELTMRELLLGLLLSSGNDAAYAIADHVAGDQEAFAALMNQRAKELNLSDTSFENASGLDGENHYTTAYELAQIAACAMQNDTFREMVSMKSAKTESGRMLSNHNRLLKLYEWADGIKTGFTKKSGRCLVSSAERNGRRLIVVTLNAPDDWDDHMRLFNYGFALFTPERLADKGKNAAKVPVAGGGTVPIYAGSELSLFLSDRERQAFETRIIGRQLVYPPISAGETYGKMAIIVNGRELGSVPLYYGRSVEAPEPQKSLWEGIVNKIASLIKFW